MNEKFANAVNCSKNIVNSVVNHGVNVAKGKIEKARSVVTDPLELLIKSLMIILIVLQIL